MSNKKGKGDIMPAIIERIISIERAETDAFMKIQKRELVKLQIMEQKKKDGEKVDTASIVRSLQRAGILDKKGDLATPYRSED